MARGARVLDRPGGLPVSTLPALVAGGLLVAVLAAILMRSLPASLGFLLVVAGLYGGTALLIGQALRRGYPKPVFGLPNCVTLLRAVLTCLFAGLAVELAVAGMRLTPLGAWCFAAIGAVALLLDGLDGYLARRLNLSTAFGARFDMEVDAALILLLSILAWQLDKAGAWVLLAGTLRYLFVAAGRVWPALARPLPPSRRRKAVCVLQGAVLCALLAPPLASPLSDALAALGLAFLLYSFAADVAWLRLRTDQTE